MTKRNGTVAGDGNESSSLVQEETLGDFRTTKIFFYFAILIASTLGNGMVAAIVIKKLRTPSNFLILNLAICDLLTPLTSIVFDFALEENNYVWLYGDFMCKLLWPAQTYFNGVSSLTLAAISLDRYRLIMHPFKTRLSKKQVSLMIVFAHVFSLVAVSPYVYVLRLQGGYCEESWPVFTYKQAYTLFLCLSQYGLPLMFMAVMYGLAIHALYGTSSRMRGSSIKDRAPQPAERAAKKLQHKRSKTRKAIAKRISHIPSIWSSPNAKAVKVFISIVMVFGIFMFPNQVVWLWKDFSHGNKTSNHFRIISIVCWLFTYTNCVVNPIILGSLSKDFREGFKVIFKGIFMCYDTLASTKVAKEEITQSDKSNKSVPTLLLGDEFPSMKPEECSLLLAVPEGHEEQPLSLDFKATKRSVYIPVEPQSVNFDLNRFARTFKNSAADSNLVKMRNFNYVLVSETPDETLTIFPYSLSHQHLKTAFSNSPETYC